MEYTLDEHSGRLILEITLTPFEIGLLLQSHPRSLGVKDNNNELVYIKIKVSASSLAGAQRSPGPQTAMGQVADTKQGGEKEDDKQRSKAKTKQQACSNEKDNTQVEHIRRQEENQGETTK